MEFNLQEDLQLIIVTYNRKENLSETFTQLLDKASPVKDCDILVLDNASTDGTSEYVQQVIKDHPNVRTLRRARNAGGNANIARAIEEGSHKYLWILGDDDYFDFSNWHEVESAIARGEKVICLSRYILPEEHKNDVAWQLVQATFITGVILCTELYTDTVVSEVYNHIHTLFPQIIPVMHHINHGGHIYVVKHPVAFNGDDGTHRVKKDLSFTRGANRTEVSPYTRNTEWVHGWAMVCATLKDPKVREDTFMHGMVFIYGSLDNARMLFETAGIAIKGDGVLPLLAFICVMVPQYLRANFFELIRNRTSEGAAQDISAGTSTLSGERESLVRWYRRSGINDQSNLRCLIVFAWHCFKMLNPFSSLYRYRRAMRELNGER